MESSQIWAPLSKIISTIFLPLRRVCNVSGSPPMAPLCSDERSAANRSGEKNMRSGIAPVDPEERIMQTGVLSNTFISAGCRAMADAVSIPTGWLKTRPPRMATKVIDRAARSNPTRRHGPEAMPVIWGSVANRINRAITAATAANAHQY